MQDPNIIGLLLNAGLAGLILALFVKGWITAKPHIDRLAKESETWRKLYETERAAHDLTRQAHAEETKAALEAATEGTQVANVLLAEIRARQSEVQR
ncbi:hypothetical protein [Nonomuraea sp. NPDC050310]|uniref:hypothetical protein n=1 Tax=Nonomuraea sp. NPDC050310 TaxID=3154935 RepID=UPI0033ECB744